MRTRTIVGTTSRGTFGTAGGWRRPVIMTAVGLVVPASLLGACTTTETPPKPEDAAAALAAGLTTGDLARVTFDGSTSEAATAAVKTVVGKLASIPRRVAVSRDSISVGDQTTCHVLSGARVSLASVT